MIHPIFSVLISKPELVVQHLSGYASLMSEEASAVGMEVAKRAIAWIVALLGLLVFLVLAGVAAMLGAMHGAFHWILLVAPGVALAIAFGGWTVARKALPGEAFVDLKAQLDADVQALHSIGGRS